MTSIVDPCGSPLQGPIDGELRILPDYPRSPTLLWGQAWSEIEEICLRALRAHTWYCQAHGLEPNSRVGLDLAISGALVRSDKGSVLADVRPVLLEGPCCNGVPACLVHLPDRLRDRCLAVASPPIARWAARFDSPMDRLVAWLGDLADDTQRVALLTDSDSEWFEANAHDELLQACRRAGLQAHHVHPGSPPRVARGRMWAGEQPIDVVYRCVERRQLTELFGKSLGRELLDDTPLTVWNNPLVADDLRSKSSEELVFRSWEEATGLKISRPRTYVGDEITAERVKALLKDAGCVVKRDDSSGGKGVKLYVDPHLAEPILGGLYGAWDGHGMLAAEPEKAASIAEELRGHGGVLQELRWLDARTDPHDGYRLVYDLRINALYESRSETWSLVSGVSRAVRWGSKVSSRTLKTNVSSGAGLAALLFDREPPEGSLEAPLGGTLFETWRAGEERWTLTSKAAKG